MNGFLLGTALAILLWFFAFLYLKNFVRRRTSLDYILGHLQEEVSQLEADIDQKTEQDLQLLEEKIHALREICAEAERRILVYHNELEKREKETQTLTKINKIPLSERIELASQAPPPAEKPVQQQINFSKEPLTLKKPPIKDRIAELHKAGFSQEIIAKKLGLKKGEIDLYFRLAEKP